MHWERRHHAEIEALQEAGEQARGATIYVTLEPCSHTGRTGPCANALIDAGVERVVAAMQDPNPLVSGRGFEKLRNAGITVEIDMDATPAAEKLNEPFVHFMRTGLPLVTLKAALTLDGKIAAPEDNSGWITSERARAHVQTLRHQSDAILTGYRHAARGRLPAHRPQRSAPQPAASAHRRRFAASYPDRIADGSVRCGGCCHRHHFGCLRSPPQRSRKLGIQVLTFDGPGGRTDFPAIAQWLAEHRYQSLMIEAGSKVNWSALESGVVDRIYFYYAPKILGGLHSLPVAGGAGRQRRADAIRFRNVTVHNIAPDEFAVEAWLIK